MALPHKDSHPILIGESFPITPLNKDYEKQEGIRKLFSIFYPMKSPSWQMQPDER